MREFRKIHAFLLMLGFILLSSGDAPKPKVLIIGDSISIGYTPFVVEALNDKAEVAHHKGNAKFTANGLEKLDSWLGTTQWDIIQFNWGMWDLCYRHPESKVQGQRDKVNGKLTTNLDDYRKNLEKLVVRLIETKAELIFVTTTMVPEKEAGRYAEDVEKYNAVAMEVMHKYKITVNNLNKLSRKVHPKCGNGAADVHYSEEGYERLSKQIIKILKKELNRL
ncbi:SGNH/GDSL hydrolase family protein [bacterium]|nr:SGNH/GDSL hydrolase family protein [bacterium]